jgi:hypothetical protein
MLLVQGMRRMAFFGRRRIGKTEFLLQDLIPAAQARGAATLYCSLWENKDQPHLGLIAALEQAVADNTAVLKRGKLQLSLPNLAEIQLEAERAERPKQTSAQELAALTNLWRTWIKSLKKQQALVVLDEIQHLASSTKFATLAATLRTLLDIAPESVHVVFTGSSQADLQRLFSNNKAAFYQFAQVLPFLPMTHDFVQHLEGVFERITSLKLPKNELGKVFEQCGRNAHLMVGLVQRLVLLHSKDVAGHWALVRENLLGPEGWYDNIWVSLGAADQLVYQQLLADQEVFSENALRLYEKSGFSRATAQKALLRLENRGLISRLGHGKYLREDPMLDDWIRDHLALAKSPRKASSPQKKTKR